MDATFLTSRCGKSGRGAGDSKKPFPRAQLGTSHPLLAVPPSPAPSAAPNGSPRCPGKQDATVQPLTLNCV